MVQFNIYFSKDLHQKLKESAKRKHVSMSQLVRELVRKGVEEKERMD